MPLEITRDKTNSYDIFKLTEGMKGGRIADTKTKEIINLDQVYAPTDKLIVQNSLVYNQNIEGETEYKLLVFKDFIQTPFFVNGIKYDDYTFTLIGLDDIVVDIELKLDSEIPNEIEYLLVEDPGYNKFSNDPTVEDRIKMNRLSRSSFFRRVRLNDEDHVKKQLFEDKRDFSLTDWDYSFVEEIGNRQANLIYSMEILPIDERPKYDLFEHYFRPIFVAKSEQPVDFMLSNHFNEKCGYVAFQVLNFKQIPFNDGDLFKYFQLDKNENGQYKINLPKVSKNESFQIFVYPTTDFIGIPATDRIEIRP